MLGNRSFFHWNSINLAIFYQNTLYNWIKKLQNCYYLRMNSDKEELLYMSKKNTNEAL